MEPIREPIRDELERLARTIVREIRSQNDSRITDLRDLLRQTAGKAAEAASVDDWLQGLSPHAVYGKMQRFAPGALVTLAEIAEIIIGRLGHGAGREAAVEWIARTLEDEWMNPTQPRR